MNMRKIVSNTLHFFCVSDIMIYDCYHFDIHKWKKLPKCVFILQGEYKEKAIAKHGTQKSFSFGWKLLYTLVYSSLSITVCVKSRNLSFILNFREKVTMASFVAVFEEESV